MDSRRRVWEAGCQGMALSGMQVTLGQSRVFAALLGHGTLGLAEWGASSAMPSPWAAGLTSQDLDVSGQNEVGVGTHPGAVGEPLLPGNEVEDAGRPVVAVEHHLQAFSTVVAGSTSAAQARCCRRRFQCSRHWSDHGVATVTTLSRCHSLSDAVDELTGVILSLVL